MPDTTTLEVVSGASVRSVPRAFSRSHPLLAKVASRAAFTPARAPLRPCLRRRLGWIGLLLGVRSLGSGARVPGRVTVGAVRDAFEHTEVNAGALRPSAPRQLLHVARLPAENTLHRRDRVSSVTRCRVASSICGRSRIGVFYRWKPATCNNCARSRRPQCRPHFTSVCSNASRTAPTVTRPTLARSPGDLYAQSNPIQPRRRRRQGPSGARAGVKAALDATFAKSGCDLEKARGTLLIGRTALLPLRVVCLAAIMAASVPANAGFQAQSVDRLKNAASTLTT